MHFKHLQFSDEEEIPDCYLEVNSADLVELISCKFGRSGPDPVEEDDFTPYEYLIKITNTGATINRGLVKIIGGSGLLRYLGRDSETNKMRIDATGHICDHPECLVFEWGPLGTVEMVPEFSTNPANPLRTHLRCDGSEYDSQDQPFAYLNVNAYLGNIVRLDDETTFVMPVLPALSNNCVPAIRAVP